VFESARTKSICLAIRNRVRFYSLEAGFLHVKRPEGEFHDLVSAGDERVKKTFDVGFVGVGKVGAFENARRLAESAAELDALASCKKTTTNLYWCFCFASNLEWK